MDTVRRAGIGDILSIRRLWEAAVIERGNAYPTIDEEEARQFTNYLATQLVLSDANTPLRAWLVDLGTTVGLLLGTIVVRPYGKPRAAFHVSICYVDPAWRGTDHGRALIAAALDDLDTAHLQVVEADTGDVSRGWLSTGHGFVHTVAGLRAILAREPIPTPDPLPFGHWTIRHATPDDVDLLDDYWDALCVEQDTEYPTRDASDRSLWRTETAARLHRQQTGDPLVFVRIVESAGVPVGFLSGWVEERRLGSPHHYWIADHLYIQPDARGQGAGTALIAAGMQHAAACGITTLECVAIAGDTQWNTRGWTPTLVRYRTTLEDMIAFYHTPTTPTTPTKDGANGRHRLQQ